MLAIEIIYLLAWNSFLVFLIVESNYFFSSFFLEICQAGLQSGCADLELIRLDFLPYQT